MINNRQGGRRRGRGGQRGQNLGGQPGNRQENRQRGNAAQLLEKYKSMARDAQLSGDRVQTEYYLQFADHYFRVLSESRARFEEQNPRRSRDEDYDGDEGDDDLVEADSENEASDDRPDRNERRDRQSERGERFSRRGRDRGDDGVERESRPERAESGDRPERGERPQRSDRSDRSDRNQRAEAEHVNGGGETIPFDVLPPAIGRDESDTPEEEPRRPRRRTRAPRPADGDEEVAPAA